MRIGDLINDGAMPALEAMVRFAGGRQRLIAHNISNISTPNFQQVDADPAKFQQSLGRAVDRRRKSGMAGEGLSIENRAGSGVRQNQDGSLTLDALARKPSRNILFHDRNNRGIEELMSDQAENLAVFRVASDLLKSRHDLLRMAIGERV